MDISRHFRFLSWRSLNLYFFMHIEEKMKEKQKKLIGLFSARSDMFPALFEVSLPYLTRHKEIFDQALSLRKQEFSLKSTSQLIESFIDVEQKIHHEINFIFQLCNKHPQMLREKRFLYLRETIISKSSYIGFQVQEYRKLVEGYNFLIQIKNYTLI